MLVNGSLRRRCLIVAAVAAVGALALVGASRAIQPHAFVDAFRDVSWGWIAVSAVIYAVGQVTSALVWHAGLRATGLGEVGRGHTIGAHWISRGASEFVPAAVGEAARVGVMLRHPVAREGGALRVVGSVGSFRAVDGGVSLLVVALLVVVLPLPPGTAAVRWVALGTAAAVGAVALLAWRLGPERFERFVPRRVRPGVRRLADGARMLSSVRHLRAAATMQVVTVAARVLSLSALLVAFGLTAGAGPVIYCLTTLAAFIAISPGGLGIREAAVVPVLVVGYGLSLEPALAVSLAIQALGLLVSVLGATAALVALRARDLPAPAPVEAGG